MKILTSVSFCMLVLVCINVSLFSQIDKHMYIENLPRVAYQNIHRYAVIEIRNR